jgi:hypothetical protein
MTNSPFSDSNKLNDEEEALPDIPSFPSIFSKKPMLLPNKADIKRQIIDEIDDVEYRYYALPHSGLIPDWFEHYWDLAELVYQYFDVPLHKPKKSTEDQVK